MRHQSSVTWVSWILFGAMDSVLHDGMGAGVGRVSRCGYGDGCLAGAQTVRLGGAYQLSYCAARSEVTSAQGLVLSNLVHPPPARRGDLVLVPGVSSDTLDRLEHVPAGWLREAHAAGARIASVCSGAFALARAGLLDGRRCTTHWKVTERLRAEYPRAIVI